MHPAMAIWIWSMAMARAWQGSLWSDAASIGIGDAKPQIAPQRLCREEQALVLANSYLYSELAMAPLPDTLLDRLADLYWTERESELAI